jgi:endonuclease YncB( thermonuclease family)
MAPPTTVTPTTAARAAAAPALTVTHVVDGDTVDVSTGERVRLIGIDTPEVGHCGADAATVVLTALALNKPVQLVAVPGRDDRDVYGRLLRYVIVAPDAGIGGTDVGLELVRQGLAVAKYDSRDGYGGHPQESAYIAADAAAASPVCAAAAVPPAPVQPVAAAGVDTRFPTCKAANAAGYGPYVRGVDPEYDWYRDADGDGKDCEHR